jgi:hypothetical protein
LLLEKFGMRERQEFSTREASSVHGDLKKNKKGGKIMDNCRG